MRNRPYGFEIYLVNVKTMRTIAPIFVAFSEKLNFNEKLHCSKNVWTLTGLFFGKTTSAECKL